jgi:hypothetical protein
MASVVQGGDDLVGRAQVGAAARITPMVWVIDGQRRCRRACGMHRIDPARENLRHRARAAAR